MNCRSEFRKLAILIVGRNTKLEGVSALPIIILWSSHLVIKLRLSVFVSVRLYKHLEWSDPRGREGRDGAFGFWFWSCVLYTTPLASLQHARHHLHADQTPWRRFIRFVTSDQELISPNSIHTLSIRQIMRIQEVITKEMSGCITKFPEVTSKKCMAIILENLSY